MKPSLENRAPEAPLTDEEYIEIERRAAEEEASHEKEAEFLETPEEVAPTTRVSLSAVSPVHTAPVVTKDEATIEVERVLEDGLAEVYMNLPESAKPLFKKKGEEVAANLAQMVRRLHLEVKKALQLIRDWLLTIPKVSKFFLEQESKIKVDMLKDLIEERKQPPENKP